MKVRLNSFHLIDRSHSWVSPTDIKVTITMSGTFQRLRARLQRFSNTFSSAHSSMIDVHFPVQEQYIFIHDALLEAVSCGNTEVHARNLLYHIKRLTEPCQGGMAGLAEEFRKLNNPSQARRLKQGAGGLAISRSKERLANILPRK